MLRPTYILILSLKLTMVLGHGRLIKPPARGTAWRYEFNTPKDFTDNEENCGGFSVQWMTNQGKCGICGDPYNGNKENETPGKYAKGIIVATYKAGQEIDVEIEITSNHKGWNEFRLCENNQEMDKEQDCFDEHLLEMANGSGTRIPLGATNGIYTYKLKLPAGVTCKQCILQWHYNTGNSWGVDKETGKGCIGCGPQETFRGCADITINRDGDAGTGGGTEGGSGGDGSGSGSGSGGDGSGTGSGGDGSGTGSGGDGSGTGSGGDGSGTGSGGDGSGGDGSGGDGSGTGSGDDGSGSEGDGSGTGSGGDGSGTGSGGDGSGTGGDGSGSEGNGSGTGGDGSGQKGCIAVAPFNTMPGMEKWCQDNCNHVPPYCPESQCDCGP